MLPSPCVLVLPGWESDAIVHAGLRTRIGLPQCSFAVPSICTYMMEDNRESAKRVHSCCVRLTQFDDVWGLKWLNAEVTPEAARLPKTYFPSASRFGPCERRPIAAVAPPPWTRPGRPQQTPTPMPKELDC